MYHPDGYLHSSTSTSGHAPSLHYHPPNVGIPPYGYDSSMFHEKPIDGKLLSKVEIGVTHKRLTNESFCLTPLGNEEHLVHQ